MGKISPCCCSYFNRFVYNGWIWIWNVSWVRRDTRAELIGPYICTPLIFSHSFSFVQHINSFSHLYGPPKSGDDSTNIQHDTSWIPESGSANGELSNKGDRQCSKHASCGSLGGNCCPSDEGIMLDCCG